MKPVASLPPKLIIALYPVEVCTSADERLPMQNGKAETLMENALV